MELRTVFAALLLLLIFSSPSLATEQVFFYHTDPAGTPLSMTDYNGNVVWTADYKPFGEEYTTTGTAENSKRFVGKEKDEETGLSYFGARYEDARTGRFIAVDPVRVVDPMTSKTNEKLLLNPQRLNVYAYALNNPYRYVDPDGRDPYAPFSSEPNSALRCHVNPHFDRNENLIGGIALTAALTTVAVGPEVVGWFKQMGTPIPQSSQINPNIYTQLEKQLAKDGPQSIHKALRSAEKTLQNHKDKLPQLEYKSQVEGTIRRVEGQIRTLDKFIKDHKL